MITTIIFDLSEVYLVGMYGIESKIAQLSGKLVPSDYLYLQDETRDFFHGKISEDEFWKRLIVRHEWGIEPTLLKKAVRSQMVEIEGTRDIIKSLSKKGYKLGLLSVHSREWIDYCEAKYDFHRFFHTKMYSFEVGISKPDPRSFTLILETLKSKPYETLFIDDSETNALAAEKLGISSIIFENSKQLKSELEQMSIYAPPDMV